MTHRLYYTDSYLCDFEAQIVERGQNGQRIYLDRTAFYPASGGQPFDTGQLGGVEVIDVVDEGERIAHLLKAPLPGDRATGKINWDRRFDHMQQHTGQHLLSAVLAELLGFSTVGVHFGREVSTLDIRAGGLPAEQVAAIEARANEIVEENRPLQVSFEDSTAANGLQKPSDRAGALRIVTIAGLDRSACGGTHVRATGEIGAIFIRKVERVRQGVRLEFLCGRRAIRRARADYDLLGRMALELSASAEELPGLLGALRNDLKEANGSRRTLQAELDGYKAKELYAGAVPDATGLRRVVVRDEGGSIEAVRGVAQAFTSMPRAVFVGTVSSPPAVVLAASPDSGIDAAGVLKSLLSSVGGRGGGSATMAQGIVPGRAQLDAVVGSIAGKSGVRSQETGVGGGGS